MGLRIGLAQGTQQRFFGQGAHRVERAANAHAHNKRRAGVGAGLLHHLHHKTLDARFPH